MRDEAHRFAITFHRSKRGKSMVASSLAGIEGLGPARRERLLERFGSLDALRQATLDELDALALAARRRRAKALRSLYRRRSTAEADQGERR